MIKLVRIDHRLLHGQVVFSWSKYLNIERIIVIDDATAKDDFKKMTLNLSKPVGITLNIFTVQECLARMHKIEELSENIMIILGNTAATLEFCKGYNKIKEINYGGIIKKDGAKQFSNAIYLTEKELEDSRELKELGLKLYMQQVPTSKSEDLNNLI